MAAPPGRPALWALLPPLLALCAAQPGPGASRGTGLSLHPPYFNLAAAARIWATATCGEAAGGGGRPQLFCKLVGGPAAAPLGRAIQGQFCDYCNAADPSKAHPITNAIDGTERWWQSPPLSMGLKYNEVNVTLDLGQLFHVAYILIKFANSPRPDLWVLERSVDFGKTYTPWQYFAYSKADCLNHFGKEANLPVRRDSDVLCTTEYSRILPLENGEIVVSLINGRPGANNFTYSPGLQEFTRATNIRLRFLRTNTLLGHLISKAQRDPTVTRRYYYSIKDISIGGRCVCHGHAEVCNPKSDENQYQFQCECQHNTCGETCDQCCPGYNQKQWQPATAGSTNICEPCNCHGHATDCYYDADVDQRRESLNIHGHYEGGGVCINCQHNTAGINCEKCAKGYYRPYGVPVRAPDGCIPCQCHGAGVLGSDCDGSTGQCRCRTGFGGFSCDACAAGYFQYPFCHECSCDGVGSLGNTCGPGGQCLCRSNYAGLRCDRCAPGYYSYPNCLPCQCDVSGTLSGVGECQQENGHCYCKSNVCGDSCDTCEAGYYALEEKNYFGCQASAMGLPGCRCDVGGSLSPACSQPSGSCRCRAHVVGTACREPEKNYFFPDLHHMKFEIEDGTTVQGGKIRFGYDPQEFPRFSWRGYAQMSSIQNEVRITLNVEKSNLYLFRIILRYINPGGETLSGRISACQSQPGAGAAQSKEFVFPPSKEPAFITIPGKSSTEPFSLAPGMWTVSIMAEEVLLDYLVLLPSDYYEASLLQIRVTEPCTHPRPASAEQSVDKLQRKPVPWPVGLFRRNDIMNCQQKWQMVNLEMTVNVPQVGRYVLVFEYANEEDQINIAEVTVHSPGPVTEGRVRIYSCKYSFLCRSVAVDDRNRIAAYDLLADTKIRLKASASNFLLHKVCIISAEEFSPEYVEPKVQCIAAYRSNSDGSAACIPSVFEAPPGTLVLDAFKDGKISEVQENILHDPLSASLPAGSVHGVTLTPLQNQITLSGRVPHLGRYVFVVHFYQPAHPVFPVQVHVNAGHVWSGTFHASFCPHTSGCQVQLIAANQIELDISEPMVSVTVMIPDGRTLVLFVDMRSWRLEAVDENMDIPVTFNPVSNSVVADVQELPPSVQNLYWKAPPSYLGEKLSSYGGFLSYQVKSFGLPSEGMVLLDKKPDIRLTGRQMEVVYMDPNNPLPDRQYYGRVQLVEGNFRHASSGRLVSREELMMILSRVDGLHIRALYFTETQRLTLGEVGLEEASSEGSGSVAHGVETCACPPQYAGDSCQECSTGFYRENKGLLLDAVCPATAMEIQIDVKMVPENVLFAIGCVANGEDIQCLCKEGYTGARCERCATGYFGNPQKYGGFCQKCNCNNNGQLASCDHLTGECFNNDPKDVDPNEDCDSCDSCVITLLKDLSTTGDELQLIKSQLQNVHASTHTLEQMRDLETRIKDLKVLLNNYRSVVHNQGSKVDELETDFIKLDRDVNALQEKAEMNYKEAEKLFNNFGQTHQKGKDLVSQIQVVVKNIQALLEQIAGTNGEGNNLPLGDASEELAEAQRMMAEMRNRNFGQLQAEAEKERTEAQRLLARIKNELQKYHQENRGLIKVVRDALNEYESKITDLREALNDATGQIKQAEGLNRDNTVLLEDIKTKFLMLMYFSQTASEVSPGQGTAVIAKQCLNFSAGKIVEGKRIEKTNVQQNGVLDILSSARSSLTQAKSVLGLLQESKEEYEVLAAQLDGARKDMNERVANLSSASKEPLVVRAEEHAKSLQDLAKQLEEIKNSARKDELVGCAVEASTAYDNIIGAIKAAEEAANQAGKAADSALSTVKREDLSGKAARLKAESSTLMDQAQEAKRTLQALGPNLEDLKQRLDVTDGKTNALKIDLVTAQNNLNGIDRGDIDSIITSARNMAENADSVTNSVLDELVPIKAEVERIKSNYGSTQSASFNKALMEANNSVKNLTNQLPDLFSKIRSINQQLMPISNISENINRIRELIQQARDAANKVAVPMRFNGSSGVEVRPPSNLEDLKGYTSLSLFIQSPKQEPDTVQRENRFVLYLGNKDASKEYIGMAVKDGYLTCVYNLGGGDGEVRVQSLVTQSKTEEAVMDQVTFERIYQYAKLKYIKAATSISPDYQSPRSASSGDSDMLLNLDPSSVVFYVGGYPPDFRPPRNLNYPRYEGCIELSSLNEHIISLYNFKRTFNLNTSEVQPCRRYKEETDQSYFEGTGYASVTAGERSAERVRYEQTIETTADEGIVFFAANGDQFISVLIENGRTVFRYKLDSETPKEVESKKPVNDGTYQQINLVLDRKKKVVYVSPDIKANIHVFNFTEYYLGGVPSFLWERFNISTPPFRGCMKNVKNPSTASVSFDKTFGVSKKCSEEWKLVRSAAFSKDGTLSLSAADFPFPQDFQVGFGFQTTASTGTLLNYNLRPDVLSIFLSPGSVTAKIRDMEIKLEKKYEDGSMHYVTVIKINNRVHLMVDDESKAVDSPRSSNSQDSNRPIKFGGDNFEGCISNIFIKRAGQLPEVQNLVANTAKTGVSLGACQKYENLEPMLLQEFKNPLRLKMLKNDKYLDYLKAAKVQNHTIPALLHDSSEAYLLGSIPNSFLSYMFSPLLSTDRLHFSVDVRTRSSRGLIIFMEESSEDSYMALHISKGHFVFSLGSGEKQIKVKTSSKYNDGQWHTVVFSTDGKSARLVVDGLRAQHRKLTTNSVISIKPPVYVGGLPPLKKQNIPMKSFKGCLRNFKVNGKVMNAPQQKNGVLPCLDVPMDTGIYFFKEGGYITIGNLLMGLDFRIVFTIRPRSSTGILLHAGSKQDNYLTVYMKGGKVIAAGNSDAGEFQVSVTPKKPLSDGQWHTIAENLDTPWLQVEDPFIGCLWNITINDKHVSTRRISEVHGAVNLHGCPEK
ncbi:hypothetical protein DUI87_07700 [Hirundo rustica rustica]|uniref:Laminin subunit alpha-3 n=1 Tax=Hirundo rustica rustica TaxID=333673 RepID=A0A3M0KQI9_HIRRU|nr:hypothetical protein DUI87_07700 [Hirundo rustica rustica]